MIIAVIDGMGGGIGEQIVQQLRSELPKETIILALGVNAVATERMLKAGASKGASGENAIRVSVSSAEVILGPIGIVLPNSMMGEITSGVCEAILSAPGRKILIPLNQPHVDIIGLEPQPLNELVSQAIEQLKVQIQKK